MLGKREMLQEAAFCPICGCKLHVDEFYGKKRLLCDRHGEMKPYLENDPKVAKRMPNITGARTSE